MTKKKEFLARIIKEGGPNIYKGCRDLARGTCLKCPLYKISYNCNAALQIYIKRMKKIDRLEFLIAIQ